MEKFDFTKLNLARYTKDADSKIQYEYQELGLELNKWFGKNCFWVLYKPEAELHKVRYALDVCKKKNTKKIGYLIGILKKP